MAVALAAALALAACGGAAALAPSSPAASTKPPASAPASAPANPASASAPTASAKPAASASAPAASGSAPAAPAKPAPSGALKHLKVGTLPTIGNAPFIIATNKGYFREEGLEIELVPFSAGSETVPALGAGQIDAANSVTPSAGLMNAVIRGLPIKIVADDGDIRQGRNIANILIRKDAQPTAGQFADLASLKKPIRAAATATDLVPDAVIKLQLQKAGISLADAQFNYLGLPDINVAFKNGNLDLAASGEPLITIAVQQGLAVRWKPMAELVPGMPYSNLMYGPNLRDKDKDAGDRLMRGFLRGVRDYEDAATKNKDRDAIVGMLNDPLKIPKELFDAMQQQGGLAYLDPNGAVGMDALQPIVDFWIQSKAVQAPSFDVKTLVDASFAEAAVQKLGKY
ncbi:MAG TPA: ABC transporter substrate-binding protein [Chloroflexota bacterium]